MGAKPEFLLLGIAIPMSKQKYMEDFIESFAAACKRSKVMLIGGDTTTSPDKIFISITAIGTSKSGHIKRRDTAKEGDILCVVGELGAAHLGVIACERSIDGFEDYKRAFLQPEAKLGEGLWLGSQVNVTSLMDLSDGLFIDLKRLCQASKLQGKIDLDLLVPDKNFRNFCEELKLDPVEAMVVGGEDYGLLFTVSEIGYEELAESFKKEFGYPIKLIGHLTKGNGVTHMRNGTTVTLKQKPFTHFGEEI